MSMDYFTERIPILVAERKEYSKGMYGKNI